MIQNYEKPQHTITIRRRPIPTAASTQRLPVVIGAQRLLVLNDGRDIPSSTYDAAGMSLNYRFVSSAGVTEALSLVTHAVEATSVKLYGTGLLAKVVEDASIFSYASTDNVLRAAADNFFGGTLNAALDGRALAVGDVLDVEVDNVTVGSFAAADETFRRKIVALLPKINPSTVNGETTGTADSEPAAGNAPTSVASTEVVGTPPSGWTADFTGSGIATVNILAAAGGRYNGQLGERITLTASLAGNNTTAQFLVEYQSLAQSETVTSVAGAVAGEFSLILPDLDGSELLLTIVAETVTLGQKIVVDVFPGMTAADATDFTTVVDDLTDGDTSRDYFITVTQGGDTINLRITDSTGTEPVQVIADAQAATSYSLGTKGLVFEIGAGFTLVTGDVFIFRVVAAAPSATEFDGVRLNGPILRTSQFNTTTGRFRVNVFQEFSGQLTTANDEGGEAPFTVEAATVEVTAGIGLLTDKDTSPFVAFEDAVGKLEVEYTAIQLPTETEGLVTITSSEFIESIAGELHPSNPLAFAVSRAFVGSGGAPVAILRYADDTADALDAALIAITNTEAAYSLCPATDNPEVIEALLAHATAMSTPRRKKWRMIFAGVDTVGRWDLWAADVDQKATMIDGVVALDVATQEAREFDSSHVGAIVKFAAYAEDFVITEILSASSVRVTGTTTIPSDSEFTLVLSDTAANRRRYVKTLANLYNSELLTLVWTDRGVGVANGSEQVLSNIFAAAELAGARAYLPAQQPLTNYTITTFTGAPRMYTVHQEFDLDDLASNGVCIVTQEAVGGAIFVRHQLTTRSGDGALYYENSLVSVAHELGARRRALFSDLIGRRNITPDLIALVTARLNSMSFAATQTTLESRDIGPLAVSYTDDEGNLSKVTVRPHPTLRDHIQLYVRYQVPAPLNGIDDYIDIELAEPFSFV